MRFSSTPLRPAGFADKLFITAQTPDPPPPAVRPLFEERADTMFHYLEAEYAGGEDAAVSNLEPKLELGRNGLESFFREPAGPQDEGVHPMCSSRRGGEYTGTLAFSHELGVDLQGKQVLSDDDTLSLFPEIKMDEADGNNSSAMDDGVEDYMSVSSFDLDNLKASSGVPTLRDGEHDMDSDFARILCGNNLLAALPKTTFHGEEHRMMAGECEKRRVEEIFNSVTQLRNVGRTCPSQPPQLGGGNAVSYMSASTPTSQEHFFPSAFVPLLPTCLEHGQNVKSFSPKLTPLYSELEEVILSPHPIRKLETVGGKKMFSSQYDSRSGYGKEREDYKIKDLGNSSREYIAFPCESPAFPETTSSGYLREYLGPASSATRSLVPDVQARTGSTSYCSDADYLVEGVELSHGYTPQYLQNKPTSGYFEFGPMQIMCNGHDLHELSLFDPVNTGSSTTRDQNLPLGKPPCTCCSTEEQVSALNGSGDVLMASFSKATDTQSVHNQSSIYMEDRMVAQSTSFEFLDKDGFVSSSIGDGIHVPVTAKRSALTIHTPEPGCTPPQDSSKLTNIHKEKRWIYKLARLPKTTQFSQVTLKQKKRASRLSEGPATKTKPASCRSKGAKKDASRGINMGQVCTCGPQAEDPGCFDSEEPSFLR